MVFFSRAKNRAWMENKTINCRSGGEKRRLSQQSRSVNRQLFVLSCRCVNLKLTERIFDPSRPFHHTTVRHISCSTFSDKKRRLTSPSDDVCNLPEAGEPVFFHSLDRPMSQQSIVCLKRWKMHPRPSEVKNVLCNRKRALPLKHSTLKLFS